MVTLSRHKYKEAPMRRLALTLLATTAAIGLAASAATAADLPRKAPAYVPPPPPPAWNWTGLYLGGNLGVGISRNQFAHTGCSPDSGHFDDICSDALNGDGNQFGIPNYLGSHNGLGVVGGVQLGYNYQFANSPIVVGIEGTYDWADIKGDHQNSVTGADNNSLIQGQERIFSKTKGIGTIVGKLGLASGPQDRTLWYVKGGGAWARTDFATIGNWVETFPDSPDTARPYAGAWSGKNNRWGWTVGTGVEWALWDNWSARIEYDYLDFGNHNISLAGSACTTPTCVGSTRTMNVKQQVHLVTVGLNYRFNWWR
jgi:outer membrane immunogenic protein